MGAGETAVAGGSLGGSPRAGLLRLGVVANVISEPVLKGFIVGLALIVIVGQVPKLLGITKGSGGFFRQLGPC